MKPKILVVVLSLIFFLCWPNLMKAQIIPSYELFDTNKQEIIKQSDATPIMEEEAKKVFANLTLHNKFNVEFNGILLKIIFSPVISIDQNISPEKISEAILHQSIDKTEQLVILITNSNRTIVCTSSYPLDSIFKEAQKNN